MAAPIQGMLSEILVKVGDKVKENQPLFVIEAMKIETTITATKSAAVANIALPASTMVNAEDLIIELK